MVRQVVSSQFEKKYSKRSTNKKGEVKGRSCERLQQAGSEASNFPKSEHTLELENLSSEIGRTKCGEGRDDSISCVSCENVLVDIEKNRLELSENCSKMVDANTSSLHMHSPKSHSESDSHITGGCSEDSTKVRPKLEVDEALKGPEQVENSDESSQMQAESQNESDESDIVLHDVNVCDICGDAGKEDLLAMCSRCSDGAEHTYCMKQMLQKVPEGDWLCEECKFAEESERQDDEEKIPRKISSQAPSCAKRSAESLECASSAKRLATESTFGSPRSSNLTRVATLSRESLFKNSDKGKTRLAPESARSSTMSPRLKIPMGNLTKSNSFSMSNSTPQVKLVDEVIPQKMRGTKELSSKVGLTKVVGKSMPLKSPNSSFSNSSESKSKISPSKYSRVQDLKGLKSIKEQNLSERKPLSKLDRSLTFSGMTRGDQKLTPRDETNINASKGVDLPLTSDGVKLVCSSAEEKLNQVNTNDETSLTWPADTQVGVTRSLESVNQGEETKGFPINRSDTAISMDQNGEKSEEMRISMDGTKKNNDLKAAIEAAMQKVPEKFAKNKPLDRSDGLSVQGLESDCDKASQDRLFLSKRKTVVSAQGNYEAEVDLQGCASDSLRQPTINNAKQLNVLATDCFRDQPSYGLSVWSSPIPEHKCIWQGAFEVHRAGKFVFCDGFQAHLSTHASPKVLEVVNKFSYKIPLFEIPRLSMWPRLFQSSGAKEKYIALYFFAKDMESYEKNYKVLVDNMIENDLGLKAKFEGVELLIFPSTLLPENCQRWNMLYFLWGVCKARRAASSTLSNSFDVPSLPQKSALAQFVDKETSLCDGLNTAVVSNIADMTPIDEACADKVSLLEQTTLGRDSENNAPDAKFLSNITPGNEQICPEARDADRLEVAGLLESEIKIDLNVPVASENSLPVKHAPITSHEVGIVASVEESSLKEEKTPKIPLHDLNVAYVDEENTISKKLKMDFNEIHGCSSSVRDEPKNSTSAERYFFPVESSVPWKTYLSESGERFPNLELGFGAKTETLPNNVDDEGLSFPFPGNEQNVKPVPDTTEEIEPEDTPVFLFGNILKK